tara:strand:- start:1084 stop:1233 length:150 start_codon:yes stop_codon:yes gene_type:complete
VTKFTSWYENQNETTRAWLDKQAIWHDSDMVKACCVGFIVGFILGALFI